MRSYEAARNLFSFIGFIAWFVIIVGAIVALVSAGGVSQYAGAGAGLLAMVPGLAIAISGFILLAFVQIGRAGVDTAEYTQQMLQISRDQLEVSKQSLNAPGTSAGSYRSLADSSDQHQSPTSNAWTSQGNVKVAPERKSTPTINLPKFEPYTDDNGFKVLNETATQLEYRGRQIELAGGKFEYDGRGFANAEKIKKHLNQLRILEP